MVFVDTGAFLARYLAGDARHAEAVSIWKHISSTPCFTSNHVLDETLTLLARRAGDEFAAVRADNIYGSSSIEILFSTREDEVQAVKLFREVLGPAGELHRLCFVRSDETVSDTNCL